MSKSANHSDAHRQRDGRRRIEGDRLTASGEETGGGWIDRNGQIENWETTGMQKGNLFKCVRTHTDLSIHRSDFSLSMYLSTVYLSICVTDSVYPSICVYLSMYECLCLLIYLSLSVYLSIYLYFSLFLFLSFALSLFIYLSLYISL